MTPPDAARSRRLIGQCNHIARVYDEQYPTCVTSAGKSRTAGPDPFRAQTTSGLYLQFYYGLPSRLWTPWGAWKFSGLSQDWAGQTPEQLNAGFLARVTLTRHTPRYVEQIGSSGPVLAVTAVDG
ncbi:hypothetical protein, partial [Nocardia cyriacigeorgica]|uniref:hypothetical protein n=1 Tax=Nocardia cyriacigeorgica TaxID=135487 RepID=UPI0018951950